MARASWCGNAAYVARPLFVERGLENDDSLSMPGTAIWTADNVSQVSATVEIEDPFEDAATSTVCPRCDAREALSTLLVEDGQ